MNNLNIDPRNRINRSLWRRGFLFIPLILATFALSQTAQAVTPAPDGGYPNYNTAEGDFALANLTSGDGNTALGYAALTKNTTGNFNTATGDGALFFNISGTDNTAVGWAALQDNTGIENTATGSQALVANTTGGDNTAMGIRSLSRNATGSSNTANGAFSLLSNTAGSFNTANGENALRNDTGSSNTAMGIQALNNNTSGSNNTALGALAGQNLTTGNNNIDIGANVLGTAGESGKIRIGKQGTQNGTFIAGIFGVTMTGSPVVVSSSGKLGISGTSSARFKTAVKAMDKASEAILALKPVTFRYKEEIDPDGIPQFGLVAEEVEKVNPDLITRDEEGKPTTVRYDAVNAMLLNEFLKEHRKVEKLEERVTQQQKQIEALTATVQKVSDQVALSKPAPQLVANP
jgi:Chaperone of endosialidase